MKLMTTINFTLYGLILMSYHEELLIRIRSAYDSGGFNKLDADLSRAKKGHDQLASNSTRNSGVMKGNFNQVSNAAKKSGDAIGRETNNGVNRATQGWNKLKSVASSTFNTISTGASKAASSVSQGISKGTDVASRSFDKLKSSASSSFGSISAGAKAASNELGGLGGVIAGLAGGMGAMEVAQSMWTGATTKQFNAAYLGTKMSSAAANDYIKQIQQIVAEVPGDDTFMNNLMTGAVAKQTNLSATELRALGIASADYLTTSQAMGKAQLETQMDLKEYILTGNTSQLERDSILKQQMDKLEGQKTVSERILALNEALKAEGYAGLSQLDIASIKAEEIKGKFQLAATTVGEKLLPYIEDFLDFMLQLDEKTQGQSTLWMVIGGSIALLALALAPVVGATMSGYYAMKNYRIEAEKAALANAANRGPGVGTGTSSGGMNVGAVLTGLTLAAAAIYITHATIEWATEKLGDPNYTPTAGGKPLSEDDKNQALNLKQLFMDEWGDNKLLQGLMPTFPIGLDVALQNFDIVKMIEDNLSSGGLHGIISSYIEKPLVDAYNSVKSWWDGLPAWFGGLGARIGQLWGDVVNYFNDKTTIGGQVYDALKKIYCIIMGCSPGIIPALQMLYLYAVFVFNAILGPVITVKNTIEGFVLYIMLRMALLQNDIITRWNLVRAIVGVWIQTGISIFTDPLGWAKDRYNDARAFISPWISSGVNVATNAIATAWEYWERFKNDVKKGVQGVVDIVFGGAGSPNEVDYLYGQGEYYEEIYSPITTTSSVTSVASVSSSTSTVISPVFHIGSISSREEADYVIQKVTKELSDLNDSKGR